MKANIIIPARKGSKGLPYKNQILLDDTLSQIPIEYHKKVIVSTNDEYIISKLKSNYPQCKIHYRSDDSAKDCASTKICLTEVIKDNDLRGDVIMLYLTYPKRNWLDIINVYKWYKKEKASSLLCREELSVNPYLCMYDVGNNKGKQIIPHNFYRRQDYPECFKICHMITIFKTNELQNLNDNLYNGDTVFYKIPKALDVDTLKDYERIKK